MSEVPEAYDGAADMGVSLRDGLHSTSALLAFGGDANARGTVTNPRWGRSYDRRVGETGLDAAAVAAAAALLAPVVSATPLERSERLTTRLGRPVLLKREDLQLCRSYKVRGAYHLVSSLD